MKDKNDLILSISTIEDLDKLKENKNIKYINIDITNPNKKIIDYLLTNGQNLYYTYKITNKSGFIYVDYETFKKGQQIINDLIDNVPSSFNLLEKSKYLYIKLASIIGYDINSIEENAKRR